MMPKIVDKAAKRQEILEAAIAVFVEKGYHSAKMADIAIAARMGKGTLYEYFPTKESLPKEIFNLFFAGLDDQLVQLQQAGQTPIEIIVTGIRLSFEGMDEFAVVTPLCFELLGNKTLSESLGLSAYFEGWLAQLNQFFANALVAGQNDGQINPDVDAKAFARMLVSIIDGMGLHYCMFQMDTEAFQRQCQELEAMIRQRLNY
ncbi:MAG: TetR/AcrR family transcriptional regulator [Leptolyngbyaceae cyanobacterium MAG.088]|nr:TetR/AcrR family transcriptional regulator [Leptolyngbyaceae cyanobacterium MAG.088]